MSTLNATLSHGGFDSEVEMIQIINPYGKRNLFLIHATSNELNIKTVYHVCVVNLLDSKNCFRKPNLAHWHNIWVQISYASLSGRCFLREQFNLNLKIFFSEKNVLVKWDPFGYQMTIVCRHSRYLFAAIQISACILFMF